MQYSTIQILKTILYVGEWSYFLLHFRQPNKEQNKMIWIAA